MRLIDADILVEWLKKAGQFLKCCENHKEKTKLIGKIIDHIENEPTIDPENLRPQGVWEKYPDWAHIRCTNCKREFKKSEFAIKMKPFCPNCGAKMAGGDSQ